MTIQERYTKWLANATDPVVAKELSAISGHAEEISDRFYRDLEFGTGGLRGILGAGTNRMNIYTVAKATQGYCNYLLAHFDTPSVAIAYDSRQNSLLFAEKAAEIFAANHIRVFLYSKLMPTPSLSFAIRDLNCSGGVVITASHNPAQYNGYKVYGADGCQITTEAATAIQAYISHIDPFHDILSLPFTEGESSGAISYISPETEARYLAAVHATSLLSAATAKDFSIVYTPLNGSGISCVPRCLQEHGFTNIIIPDEQRNPDGNFPTCPSPNPEVREALEVGLHWAKETGSDLLLATDPDCDRVGAAVKDGASYTLISGNQMGVLLLDFICQMRIQNGTMPASPIAVKTIVTTPMAQQIADHYGVTLINVLTGFKYIGEQISILEQAGEAERFIFGFEESYGYLSSSSVRDKDAVNASLLICEMFAFYKAQNLTLVQVLTQLYQRYGFYGEKLLSFQLEGKKGFMAMHSMLDTLRHTPPTEIAGYQVSAVIDYQTSRSSYTNGITQKVLLPKSNVIQFQLENGASIVLRPSGTEPKLKLYLSAVGKVCPECQRALLNLEDYFVKWVHNF